MNTRAGLCSTVNGEGSRNYFNKGDRSSRSLEDGLGEDK